MQPVTRWGLRLRSTDEPARRRAVWIYRALLSSFIVIVGSFLWLISPATAQGGASAIAGGTTTDTAPLVVLGSGLTVMTGVVALFGRALASGALVPRASADREDKLITANEQLTILLREANEREAESVKREDRQWEWMNEMRSYLQSGSPPMPPHA